MIHTHTLHVLLLPCMYYCCHACTTTAMHVLLLPRMYYYCPAYITTAMHVLLLPCMYYCCHACITIASYPGHTPRRKTLSGVCGRLVLLLPYMYYYCLTCTYRKQLIILATQVSLNSFVSHAVTSTYSQSSSFPVW